LSYNPKAVTQAPSDDKEALLGQYGLASQGKVVPFIEVLHSTAGASFLMQEWGTGDWNGAVTPGRPLTDDESSKVGGAGINVPFVGLSFGQQILIKVPRDWHHGIFGTSTGFLLLTSIGPIELTRM
jgi:hypothetical protein